MSWQMLVEIAVPTIAIIIAAWIQRDIVLRVEIDIGSINSNISQLNDNLRELTDNVHEIREDVIVLNNKVNEDFGQMIERASVISETVPGLMNTLNEDSILRNQIDELFRRCLEILQSYIETHSTAPSSKT